MDWSTRLEEVETRVVPELLPPVGRAERGCLPSGNRTYARYDVYHPRAQEDICGVESGGRKVGSIRIEEEEAPSWLTDLEYLAVAWDEDGSLTMLGYPYRTRYAYPAFGAVELDPAAPEWVSLPAGTYTIETINRVARLWRWDAVNSTHCPPNGAGEVLTRQQPNDVDVPIQYVPAVALPDDAQPGDALVEPEDGDGQVPISEFTLDSALGERTRDVLAEAQRDYATDARGASSSGAPTGTEAAADAGSLFVHYDPKALSALIETDHVVVVTAAEGSVTVRPLSVRQPSAGRSISQFVEGLTRSTPEFDDGRGNSSAAGAASNPSAFDFVAGEPVVGLVTDADAYYGGMGESAVAYLDHEIDLQAIQRGDVLTVSESANVTPSEQCVSALSTVAETEPSVSDLETVRLSYAPVYTGLLRHQFPTLPYGNPEIQITSIPNRHQVTAIQDPDGAIDDTFMLRPINAQSGLKERSEYECLCKHWELPPSNGVFTVRYEAPTQSLDGRRRFTRLFTDPDLLALQLDALETLVDHDGWVSKDGLKAALGVETYISMPMKILADRGLVEKGEKGQYRVTDAGRQRLAEADRASQR